MSTGQAPVGRASPPFGIRDGLLVDAWRARDQSSGEVLLYRVYDGGGGVRVTMTSKGLSGDGLEQSVGAQASWTRGSTSAGRSYVAAAPASPDIPWFVAVQFDDSVVTITAGSVDVTTLAGIVDRVVPLEPELDAAELDLLARSRAELAEIDSAQVQQTRVRVTEDAALDRRFVCLTVDADSPEVCRPLNGVATSGHVVSGDRWFIVALYPRTGSQPEIRTEPSMEAAAADSDRYHYLLYEAPEGTDRVRLCITVESAPELCTDFDRLLS